MRVTSEIPAPRSPASPGFLTTRWSLVRAGGHAAPEVRRRALEELVRAYWYPLYAFARRRGQAPEDAADLTQGFFARLLERDDLARLEPAGGRFRAWLLAAFKNHRANERLRARAAKRGGAQQIFSLDAAAAEARYDREPPDEGTPEHTFDRAWVRELLEGTLERLRAEQARIGRAPLFDGLRPALTADPDAPRMARVARDVGLTENAVKVALHRLRRRFGELLRDEVAATVETPEEVEEELRALFRASESR